MRLYNIQVLLGMEERVEFVWRQHNRISWFLIIRIISEHRIKSSTWLSYRCLVLMGGALTVGIRKSHEEQTGGCRLLCTEEVPDVCPTGDGAHFFPLPFPPITKIYWHVTHIQKSVCAKQTAHWIFTSWTFLCKPLTGAAGLCSVCCPDF